MTPYKPYERLTLPTHLELGYAVSLAHGIGPDGKYVPLKCDAEGRVIISPNG